MNQLPPPAPLSFSGNIAENYKRFAQAFDIYLIATGISEKSKKVRASVLLHVIGEDGQEDLIHVHRIRVSLSMLIIKRYLGCLYHVISVTWQMI